MEARWARIQVHKAGDEVKVFSRNLREVTAAVPEVVEAAQRLPAHEVIFDGEVLALRPMARRKPSSGRCSGSAASWTSIGSGRSSR
jgi:hypothetical protein